MNPIEHKSANRNEIGVFFFFSAYWLLLVFATKTISSGFHLIDDSLYFSYNEEINKHGFWQAFQKVFSDDLTIRFRPITIFYYTLIAHAINHSYFFIAAINVLITIISCFSFFSFARNLGIGRFLSIFFVLILYTGNQGSISYWIATNENLGMFFLSISLYFGSRSYFSNSQSFFSQAFEIIFFMLAALSKESFLLLAPAMVFGRYMAASIERNLSVTAFIKQYMPYLIAFALVTASISYFIITVVGINSLHYAGIDVKSFDIANILNAGARLVFTKGYGTVLLVAAVFFLLNRKDFKPQQKKSIALFVALFLLITVPQIVLYAKTQIFMRYLLPGLLGGALLLIFALRLAQQKFSTSTFKLILHAVAIVLFLGNLYLMVKGALIFAEDGRITNEIISSIRKKTNEKDPILIAGDPVRQSEPVFALAKYLKSPMADRKNISIEPFVTDSGRLNPLEKETLSDFKKMAAEYGSSTADKRNMSCLVLFPTTENYTIPNLEISRFDMVELGQFKIYFLKRME